MSKNIHIKKFDKGRRTPQEYHAEHAFPPGARCVGCSTPPSIRALVFAPLDEAQKRNMLPNGAALHPAVLACMVMFKDSSGQPKPFVRISITYCCRQCRSTLEKTLARGPSWCVHEIQEGPDPTNRVVGQA